MKRIIPTRTDLERTYFVHQYKMKDVGTHTYKVGAANLMTLECTFKPWLKLSTDGTMYNAPVCMNLAVVEAKVMFKTKR